MAVMNGLQVQCVHRLRVSWAGLQARRERTCLKRLADMLSPEDNYGRLRVIISDNRLPCIPYLGALVLQTFNILVVVVIVLLFSKYCSIFIAIII
ncbi:unnamed protein product [Protopolystoma xenopodis]|uniref:Ras-GEF domain-containing protein n=1 Tax=Protopolystoma xenopodis TaxID=117903 RepID=A0A448XLG9_9PLAT|nr:unnamed protein product [Protopolystoma xenopodis]